MNWQFLRKLSVGLPMALAAAVLLIGINEGSYQRSHGSLTQITQGLDGRGAAYQLLRSMLSAETGQRGYLLTDDPKYLQPYKEALEQIEQQLAVLKSLEHAFPDKQPKFTELVQQVSRKLSEMELTLRLHDQGNNDAWKFILLTDVGKENMERIRAITLELATESNQRMLNAQQSIDRSLLLARLGIATVTLCALVAFLLYLRNSAALQTASERQQQALSQERERLTDMVNERTATLGELATHLQRVREEERGHLARELHDELGAILTAAKLDVARLKSRMADAPPEMKDRLKHLTDTLNNGIALKRRIIEDLRPSSLTHLGLTPSLEILTREFAERSGIEVECNFETVRVHERAQLTIYRMVQEALTNIGKYAQASRVQVTVHQYPTHVSIEIKDNGSGFDPQQVNPNSHGLVGMRHRVQAEGGWLTVNSSPGQGTSLIAIVPSLVAPQPDKAAAAEQASALPADAGTPQAEPASTSATPGKA